MTNKEYIRWLKLLDEELTFDALVDGKDEIDMHEMIFELCEKLEQEPKTDVDKAREEIQKFSNSFVLAGRNDLASAVSNCITIIDKYKPQEPKTGHWIHTEECDEEWQYRCSKCNMPSRSNSHRYCSNCGSYMYSTKMESEVSE